MATVTRYVNTASSGGDGTTNGESGATAAYASLNAWEAAEQTDLVAAGDVHVVNGSVGSGSAADTSAVTLSGWTTGASNDITIKQSTSDRHAGIYSTSIYRREVNNSANITNSNGSSLYLTIDGLQIDTPAINSTNQGGVFDRASGTGTVLIENCIFRGSGSAAQQYHDGIQRYTGSTGTWTVRNCAFYDYLGSSASNGGISIWDNVVTDVDNCTFYNCRIGVFRDGGTVTLTNNLARNMTTACYQGTFDAASDYNSADDTTATTLNATKTSGSPWDSSADADSDYFLDVSTDDFRPGAGDLHIDVGDDLSSSFTYDAVGTTRPTGANTWDLGFFEFVSAAAEFAASVTGSATVAATLATAITAAASIVASAVVAGALATSITLASGVSGSASVAGALSTNITAAASISGVGTASGTLEPDVAAAEFAAAIDAVATVVGALSTSITPAASVTGAGTVTGALSTSITMAGSVSASGTVGGDLDTSITAAGAISGTGAAAGALATEITAAAAISGTATVAGDLTTGTPSGALLAASVQSTAIATATLWVTSTTASVKWGQAPWGLFRWGEDIFSQVRVNHMHLTNSQEELVLVAPEKTLELTDSEHDLEA